MPTQVWSSINAVLFDLDGVITPPVDIHQRAWLEALSAFAASTDDYHNFIDGRPRIDGVRGFLRSRNIELPEGSQDEEPSLSSFHGLAARKNSLRSDLRPRDTSICSRRFPVRVPTWVTCGHD